MKQITHDAITVYLKNVETEVNTSKIDSILNLPDQYRWYAANNLLNKHEIEVYKNAGGRKNKPDKFIDFFASLAKEAVQNMAYKKADFGRYQSTHTGNNSLPEDVKVRLEAGLRYSRKYTSNDLYADFFFSASDKNPFNFLIKLGLNEKIKKVSLFDLPISNYIDNKHFDFIYNSKLFKKAGLNFNKEQVSVKFKDFEYHIPTIRVFAPVADNENYVKEIILSFQNRKRAAKHQSKFFALDLSKIVVTVEDSIKAGNCEIGTLNFAKYNFNKEMKDNTPITGEMLWNKRQDNYVKRAIMKAAGLF